MIEQSTDYHGPRITGPCYRATVRSLHSWAGAMEHHGFWHPHIEDAQITIETIEQALKRCDNGVAVATITMREGEDEQIVYSDIRVRPSGDDGGGPRVDTDGPGAADASTLTLLEASPLG